MCNIISFIIIRIFIYIYTYIRSLIFFINLLYISFLICTYICVKLYVLLYYKYFNINIVISLLYLVFVVVIFSFLTKNIFKYIYCRILFLNLFNLYYDMIYSLRIQIMPVLELGLLQVLNLYIQTLYANNEKMEMSNFKKVDIHVLLIFK